jgi:hypothetical protein
MLFFLILFLVSILVLLVIYKLYKYFTNLYRETFVSEDKKKNKNTKKFIVVVMEGIIPENIDYVSEDLCKKILPDCTIKFKKNKISSSKTVNITNDKSLDTKTNKSNVNYVVLYKNDNGNSYKKKFIKKWCNKKMKSKGNYLVIDYNNIMTDFPNIMIDVKNKFNIDLSNAIDLSSLLNMKSIGNLNKVMNNAMTVLKM